jgi:hypothetical protein
MRWVTWENVGVDRIGCAWLIRKHIDPQAQFVFIRHGSQEIPAGAEPFDIPGVKFSHHGGHCSFVSFLREYKLNDPVLSRIGAIVDEADTVQEAALEPASAGLDLICRGIRRTSPDDQAAIERGRLVYEALYAELRAEQIV